MEKSDLKKLAKTFGRFAPTVLAWPNVDFSSKVGKKRVNTLPDNLRPLTANFYRFAHHLRNDRDRTRQNSTVSSFTSFAQDGQVYVKTCKVSDFDAELADRLRAYKCALFEARQQRWERLGVPFDLLNKRYAKNLAKRHQIRVDELTTWNGYGYKVYSRPVDPSDQERWVKVYLENKPKEKMTLRDKIPAELHSYVCEYQELGECSSCGGHGLVYNANIGEWGRDVRCKKCDGRGERSKYAFSPRLAREALKLLKKNVDPQEIKRILQDDKANDDWDGTLTSTWLKHGEISEDEANRIREKCRQRHEGTNYDALLKQGYTADEARLFSEDV